MIIFAIIAILLFSYPTVPAHAASSEKVSQQSENHIITILDRTGHLAGNITQLELSELQSVSDGKEVNYTSAQRAQSEIELGEYDLAALQEPEDALALFQNAEKLLFPDDNLYGLAQFDSNIAMWKEGRYQEASDGFKSVLDNSRTWNQ
jgi:hypothetical protein